MDDDLINHLGKTINIAMEVTMGNELKIYCNENFIFTSIFCTGKSSE